MPDEKSREPSQEISEEHIKKLRARWIGQEDRIQKIIESAREQKYEDWTVHLVEGLPNIDEIKPVFEEKYGRDLRGISLSKADLTKADFRNADLRWAELYKADLAGANLRRAKLKNATMQEAVLSGAILHGAVLEETFLLNAKLENAILHEADLSKACLIGANLSKAQFNKTTLVDTELSTAKLRGANLRGIDLEKAVFRDTSLRDADLQDANLKEAKGLLAEQLGGANVCNAKLPVDIQKFEALGHVEEASKNARKIFLTMLLGCVYSWLTIATTTDVRLLTNSASSPLPIIRTEIPIAYFFWIAPALLFGFYIYFHLYLQRLWEGLAELPAIFPDGKALDKRAYPWLLIGLVRTHFKLLRSRRPTLSQLQEWISIVLAWWSVPITMFIFWLRYLYRHGWWGTLLHILLLGLSVAFGMTSYHLAIQTLRGERRRPCRNRNISKQHESISNGAGLVHFISNIKPECKHLWGECQGIIDMPDSHMLRWITRYVLVSLVLSCLAINGLFIFPVLARANLHEADVSTKPPNWTGENFNLIKGAKLEGIHLESCDAYSAFLIYADLRRSHLRKADLRWSFLQGAMLRDADLREADLRDAILWQVKIRGKADLRKADLRGARLGGAKINAPREENKKHIRADLRKAKFNRADFSPVKIENSIYRTDLSGADLSETEGLTIEQLEQVIIDKHTILPKDLADTEEELAEKKEALLDRQKIREIRDAKEKEKLAQEQK